MKKIFLIIALFFGMNAVVAQNNIKMAHFDSKIINDSLPSIKSASKEYEAYQAELAGSYEELVKELEDLQTLYERQRDSLSTTIRELREEKIRDLANTIQYKQQDYQVKLEREYNRLMEPITKNLEKAVQIVADRMKINYVFEKSSLIYVNGGLDITEEVKAEMLKLEAARLAPAGTGTGTTN